MSHSKDVQNHHLFPRQAEPGIACFRIARYIPTDGQTWNTWSSILLVYSISLRYDSFAERLASSLARASCVGCRHHRARHRLPPSKATLTPSTLLQFHQMAIVSCPVQMTQQFGCGI
ncbi:hypothetical protein BDR05DRAFT_107706 [Suillus weaverae]|nr:hypothetical protein BDR05DRAFT_107706 [Suillus weaverae]